MGYQSICLNKIRTFAGMRITQSNKLRHIDIDKAVELAQCRAYFRKQRFDRKIGKFMFDRDKKKVVVKECSQVKDYAGAGFGSR